MRTPTVRFTACPVSVRVLRADTPAQVRAVIRPLTAAEVALLDDYFTQVGRMSDLDLARFHGLADAADGALLRFALEGV